MIRTIVARDFIAQLERDFPICLRPDQVDPEIIREMVARGLERRNTKRPSADRRKADECSSSSTES